MKTTGTIHGKCRLMILAGSVILAAFSARAAESHSVTGIVLKVDQPHQSMVVSCRAIPGYMEAMVMPFQVREARELNGVAPGAVVEFSLVVNDDSSYAEGVHIRGFESLEQDPRQANRLTLLNRIVDPTSPSLKTLSPGEHVPDFSLIDQNRNSVTLSEFAGKVVVITFIYTRCPLPNFCFRLSNNFGLLQRRFADRMGRDLILLSVSFDPVHDQPEVLARYASIWKANAAGWHLLTGNTSDVEKLCHSFGMNFWPDEGVMTHSLHTAVIDQHGNLLANLEGNEFTAGQLGDLVETVMSRR